MALLFVALWELALTFCQLGERPIQIENKKKSYVSILKIITHNILRLDIHTHYKPGSCSKKQECAHVCTLEIWGQETPSTRARCPSNSNASVVVGKTHRVAINVLCGTENINTSSNELRGQKIPLHPQCATY